MSATVVEAYRPAVAARSRTVRIPWPVVAVLTASTFVAAGIIWDISWHMTIGRDTFWTPAHLMEYIGGLLAGLACGVLVLRTTFAGTAADRRTTVRFWGFRGPLGAWVAIWGTFTMLTSAPFDNWWHNAYGLDVKILSPPHVLLAIGIMAIQVGAMLMTVAWQNRVTAGVTAPSSARWADASTAAGLATSRFLYAYAVGLLLLMLAIVGSEFMHPVLMHSSVFYLACALIFPFVFALAARSSSLRWPATSVAAIYMAARLIALWVLPLFPAQPKLGPVYQHVTHMVPLDFPLLLIVPAFAMDLVLRRTRELNGWLTALLAGLVFLVVFAAVQWPFASFLEHGPTRNWFFATNNYAYQLPKWTHMYRHEFVAAERAGGFARRMAIAALVAVLTTRLGLGTGNWMRRVWR